MERRAGECTIGWSAAPAGCRKLCNLHWNSASVQSLVRMAWKRRRKPNSEAMGSGARPEVSVHPRCSEPCSKNGRNVEDGNRFIFLSDSPRRHTLWVLARTRIESSHWRSPGYHFGAYCPPKFQAARTNPDGGSGNEERAEFCRCSIHRCWNRHDLCRWTQSRRMTNAAAEPFPDPGHWEPAECSRKSGPCHFRQRKFELRSNLHAGPNWPCGGPCSSARPLGDKPPNCRSLVSGCCNDCFESAIL